LDTKSTPTNKNFDSKQVTQSFKGIVDTVKNRPVYVIAQNAHCGYDLVDYNSRQPVLSQIPTKHLADMVCEHCNTKNRTVYYFSKAQQVLEQYTKLYNDTTVYSHIAYNSKDNSRASVARMRLMHARQQMEQLLLSLKLPV
jgi:UDP-N-acetyl-D-mannosaminuronic acid transferase (WecB/TagA/CpsF family)